MQRTAGAKRRTPAGSVLDTLASFPGRNASARNGIRVKRAAKATAALGIIAINTSEVQSRLFSTDFEEDIEFYRHAKGKAGDADDHPNRCFLDSKDISIEVRDGIRDPRMIDEVPEGRNEDPETDDTRDSIE